MLGLSNSEKELLDNHKKHVFMVHQMERKKKVSLDEISEIIPGIVHRNKLRTSEMLYLGKPTRELFSVSVEDIITEGIAFTAKFIHPVNFKNLIDFFKNVDFKDRHEIYPSYQYYQFPDMKGYKWHYSVKKMYDENSTISFSTPILGMSKLEKKIVSILDENLVIKKYFKKFLTLTKRERDVMKLIAEGYNSKNISELLFISIHTVSTHRKNIWNKLEISSQSELFKIAQNMDLTDL